MPKVFKRGRFYWYRLSRGGKQCWHSTGETNRSAAQDLADTAKAAARGEGSILKQFIVLQDSIGRLPPKEQSEMRLRLSRQLTAMALAPLTLADAWAEWVASPQKGNPCAVTVSGYKATWQRFVEWAAKRQVQHMHEVTEQHADEYARDLWRNKFSPRSFNGHIQFLRSVFTTLRVTAGLADNPWQHIRKMARDTQGRLNFTPEELATLCRKARGTMRYMLAIGLYTGLRLGDVVTLRWSNLQPGRIELSPRKTRRKGKTITIPLHPVLAALLEDRRRQVPQEAEYVFPEEATEYLREVSAFSKRFQNFLRDCGIATFEKATGHRQRAIVRKGFHSLRHSFVSLCAINRVPQVAIQDLVGHGSPAMTALYSHADFDQKRAAIAALPEIAFAPAAAG
ncbi:MAG: tyrosine-type recombinase/integrase [Kiritimatiellaeota bacterium]|nr:tyrosine-type recombinase/integrase [Kiritimatiellota bacterium]